ncbi:cobalt-precorrin-6A reductase [Krasilnikovia sp. MM14-A1004]|uniref:cobalt-precorrin-6A reductase n=1 Tax=Krasilnikovia sp. MM14-A1004 TaxID=3373541 RepID=UPI00399C97FB
MPDLTRPEVSGPEADPAWPDAGRPGADGGPFGAGLRVLILGGTSEGRELAAACAGVAGLHVTSSLAGRTSAPLRPVGELRVGGFGGVDGLISYLRSERIGAVVDATHPFAATMSAHAVAASARAGVPLLVLRRTGFVARPGDDWHRVPTVAAAAELVPALGQRVFLTTGRQSIAAFAGVGGCWFLSRSVEPPQPPVPPRLEVVLDRGPFTVEGERALLDRYRIDVLVTKDSGGAAPKLDAARERGIPVVMIDRPSPTAEPGAPASGAAPPVEIVATIPAVLAWLTARGATDRS